MAKTKAPTPQELYWERKQREERERTAYLPPGLINHGNTCFMNSVLQGLIATRLLSDLVHFYPIPAEIQRTASTPIVSRRSPQLTNGHNLAGRYEQPWVNTMPIGDMFLTVMYKAWDSQAMRRRDVLSPKSILAALGQKYDQYLDFAQQDAHEFLRILLDAMRMEEQDIIKKRQPPPPKKRRRTTITPSSIRQQQQQRAIASSSSSSQPNGHIPNGDAHPTSPDPSTSTSTSSTSHPNPSSTSHSHSNPNGQEFHGEEEQTHDNDEDDDLTLLSFADMIFGGQLTSILVCQKCKHVSQTYEDFNDISLSIKAEDYLPQNRKRDRFKRMVGRLTTFPGGLNSSSNSNSNSNSSQPAHLRDPLKFAAQQLRAAATPPASTSSAGTSTSTTTTTTTASSTPTPPPHIPHIAEIQRSSSVPPSPRKEEKELAERDSKDEPRVIEGPRRRSLDVVRSSVDESSTSGGESPEIPGVVPESVVKVDGEREGEEKEKERVVEGMVEREREHERSQAQAQVVVNVTGPPEEKHVEFVEPVIDKDKEKEGAVPEEGKEDKEGKERKDGKGKDKEGKDKEKEKEKNSSAEDGWAKLGRRISLTVGLGRQRSGEKDKEKDKERKDRDRDRKSRSMERSNGSGLGFIKEMMPEEMLKSFSTPSSSAAAVLGDLGNLGIGSAMGLGKKRVASDGGQPSSSWGSGSGAETEGEGSSSSAAAQKVSKPLPPQPTSSSNSIPTTSNPSPSNATTTTSQPTLLQPQPQPQHHHHHHHLFPHVQRSKSPKPPKPSAAETEYLRRILADVSVSPSSSSSSSGAGGAFSSIFRPALLHSHSSGPAFTSSSSSTSSASFSWTAPSHVNGNGSGSASASGSGSSDKEGEKGKEKEKEKDKDKGKGIEKPSWLGMGLRNFTGLEECLRMFTAVEVLDGENMVGCRRCWKIQNGVYKTPKQEGEEAEEAEEADSDHEEDEEAEAEDERDEETAGRRIDVLGAGEDVVTPRPPLSVVAPPVASIPSTSTGASITTDGPLRFPTSISTPTVSFYSHDNDTTSDDADADERSISSLPTEATSAPSGLGMEKETVDVDGQPGPGPGPGGLPIPVISTTAPDSPPPMSAGGASSSSSAMEANRASAYARLTGNQDPAPSSSSLNAAAVAKPPSVPAPHPRLTQALYGYNTTSGSRDSLVIPTIGRPRPGRTKPRPTSRSRKSYSDATTTDENEDESSEEEDSDTSAGTSVSADSVASGGSRSGLDGQREGDGIVSQEQQQQQQQRQPLVNGHPALVTSSSSTSSSSSKAQQQPPQASSPSPSAPAPSTKKPSKPKAPKAPKPVIMRPAYKRYLIATPPPVLVIHLKRFQQTSKSPLIFSHGFKKLEDYVSFPEYLDLTPFLAPRKEDYGLGRKGRGEGKEGRAVRREERCMYRLYAVVVHIGNMLGGHYIAYTALPNESPVRSTSAPAPAAGNGNEAGNSGSGSESSGDKAPVKPDASSQGQGQAQGQGQPSNKPAERQWAYISDTVVRLTTLEEVLHAKAYICMYERC